MTMPNIMNATMQPLPDIAGAVGAAAGSIQMTAGAASSGLVAVLFDARSAVSMAAVMAACSLLALIAYYLLARPAERGIDSRAGKVPAAIEDNHALVAQPDDEFMSAAARVGDR
jgi:DHA1 family bicyclomycin/chloramphenicol resistance-like MFS transporter